MQAGAKSFQVGNRSGSLRRVQFSNYSPQSGMRDLFGCQLCRCDGYQVRITQQ